MFPPVMIGLAFLASLLPIHAANIVTFREGVNGYAGTHDTFISSGAPATDNSAATAIEIDQEGDAGEFLLIRFENLFGTGANQIPSKSKILYGSLTVRITNTGNDPKMHQMLVPWQESSTWESLVDGILADGVEAAIDPDVTFPGNGSITVIPLPVSTLQAWSDGTKPNHGWVFLPGGTDGTDFSSSEHSNLDDRPLLTVVWSTVDEPFVRSVRPLSGATGVSVDSNVEIIVVDGTTPKLNPNSVQLSVNGQSVTPKLTKPADSNETTILYDPPTDLPQNSKISVRLVYGDTATPPHVNTNDFSFTTRATTVTVAAIDEKTVWRFDRTAVDLGTAWREKNFNDSAWEQGPALIADEGGGTAEPIRTQISRFSDNGDYLWTVYFRFKFTYNGPLGGDLLLRHVVDDGVVFYLNGTEIHRFGLAAGTPVAWDTSFDSHENRYEGPFVIPGKALVAGENVLAADVHQSGAGSSDLVFGAELLVSTTPPAPPPPPAGVTLVTNVVIRIDDQQKWRYENTGKDLGTAWKEKNFNDSAWPEGAALLALESGATSEPIRTTLKRQDAAGVGIMTDYFRTHFNFTGDPATTKLSLRHLIDDGFVLYLNGAEVYRFGIAAGPVTVTTAAASHEGRNIWEGPFDIPAAALVKGDNVLAAEVHQTDVGSSDIVFGLELLALTQGPLPPPSAPGLISNVVETGGDNEPTDTITAKWTGQTFTVSVASEPIPGAAIGDKYTVGLFGNHAPAFVDRNHRYTNASDTVSIPAYLVGGEYIMSGNDNRDNASYVLDVTVSQAVQAYMLIDNRLGDPNSANSDPPSFGPTKMQWLLDQGWAPVLSGKNRAGSTAAPDEVGIDEGADGSINQWYSVYTKAFPAGAFQLKQADNSGQNMYGVVITRPAAGDTKPTLSKPTRQGNNLTLTWTGGRLQEAPAVTGPWTDVANASSPFNAALGSGAKFYRVRQ